MKAHFELKNIIQDINGESYKSYKSIEGEFLFNDYIFYVDHVQDDAFSSPSKMRVKIAQSAALFPDDTYFNRSREVALRDFITRRFYESIRTYSKADIELKESGSISIENPGQEILERSTAFIDQSYVEIRFTLRLPYSGNNVEGNLAEDILFNKLPKIINNSLLFENLDKEALYQHIKTYEDADFLRNELENLRLIAFVAEGSILPRRSDGSTLPIEMDRAVPFVSPNNLKMDVELPNKGQITGMGLPRGITLIVGESGQGKSTLLNALELGIYNHIPGDGREYAVSNPNSVKIRAEEDRNIENVDISAFVSNHSSGKNIHSFSSENAGDYVSQAANVTEAIEIGADVLLIDEDTSASNFLIPEQSSSEGNAEINETITPFVDQARNLYSGYMVSSILVIDGPGNYFDIADFVIRMTNYEAQDITLETKKMADKNRIPRNDIYFGTIPERIPLVESLDPGNGIQSIEISPKAINYIEFGSSLIDLSFIEQVVSINQMKAICKAIMYSKKYMDGRKSFRQLTSLVMLDIERSGLDVLNPSLSGEYAEFRKIELAAVFNRINSLKIEQK